MATAAPTSTRFVLAGWLCGLSGVLYLDRICMSQAVKPIQRELDLSNTQISYVMMAFTLAYGLFEIPSGWLGDRYGSRLVLTRIVVWWSIFTVLTGAAWGFASLLVVRFLFGAGEAGAFPNAARVISRWYPVRERGRVQGVMLAAAQFGAVLAPVAAAALIASLGWRWAFGVFGLFGIAWAIGFWNWFRDDPAIHPKVNAHELALIREAGGEPVRGHQPVPWAEVLTHRGIISLGSIMILGAFFTYFFYSWFPKYLEDARGVTNQYAGTLASLVLACSAAGMLLGGWLADQFPRRVRKPIAARRWLGVACYLVAAVCLFVGIRCESPLHLAWFWGASFCFMHITLPNWWSVAIPQCGPHVGAIFGLMNGVGVLGAMASQWFVGAYSDYRKRLGFVGRDQWDPLFDVYVGVLVCGALAWWSYRDTPLRSELPGTPNES
jgi:MFS family permease